MKTETKLGRQSPSHARMNPSAGQQAWENVEIEENRVRSPGEKKKSVLPTELCLCEVKDKAASGVIFWRLDDFNGFLCGSARGIHVGGRD